LTRFNNGKIIPFKSNYMRGPQYSRAFESLAAGVMAISKESLNVRVALLSNQIRPF
jgi:hypothetical protein